MQFTNRTMSYVGSRLPARSIRARGNWPRDRRPLLAVVGALVFVVISAGCAKRIPEPAGGHTGSPHLGWVIMHGDAENPDREFACQSEPRTECVIPVDRANARVLGHVHFYYHAASTETKYTGAIRIGFFDQPHDINPSITVKPGASAGNQSVSDFVTAKPGTYTLSFSVVATSTQSGKTQNIGDQVSVVVR